MKRIFDESLVMFFYEVVEKSIPEVGQGEGMPKFQEVLKDGFNKIGAIIQQRLLEQIDAELTNDCSRRKGWSVVRRTASTLIWLMGLCDLLPTKG